MHGDLAQMTAASANEVALASLPLHRAKEIMIGRTLRVGVE